MTAAPRKYLSIVRLDQIIGWLAIWLNETADRSLYQIGSAVSAASLDVMNILILDGIRQVTGFVFLQ
ncbi:hypothetical protein [Paenibacillus sp. NRS-1781]|uniref:hypothetical protein n=1 Tax=Paenibacillus sp. NRS-1781 TaxID=3233905 RepID=UPI003D2657CB